MPLTIGTNVSSMYAQRALGRAQDQGTRAIKALSSGTRLSSPSSDAAGYAIAESLRAQISGVRQASRNAASAGSMVQVAEGSLNEQNNILLRMRELSIQSASDTVSDVERNFMQNEMTQLISEFDRIAHTSRFGSRELLTGESGSELRIQVGANSTENDAITYNLDADTRASSIKIDGVSVGEQEDAIDSLESIDEALTAIASIRANYGAIQERLEYARNNNDVHFEALSEARSHIADVDVAEEVANLTKSQILQQFSTSLLGQANAQAMSALKLLG